MRTALTALLVVPFALVRAAPAEIVPDPSEILRLAFEAQKSNEKRVRQYTFHETVEERSLTKKGEVKDTESKTYDVTLLDGEEYRRLIAKDGAPLGPEEEAKQQRKLEKSLAGMHDETEKDRRKRRERIAKEHEEEQKWRAEVMNAFDLTFEGIEEIDGVPCFRVHGEPKPGWDPSFRKARFLGKIRGTIWIAQQDYGWVRFRTEVVKPMTFGLFLLKLKPGSTIAFDQNRNDEGVWLPVQYVVNVEAKLGLIKGLRQEIAGEFSNYRKFAAESELIVAGAEPTEAAGHNEPSP